MTFRRRSTAFLALAATTTVIASCSTSGTPSNTASPPSSTSTASAVPTALIIDGSFSMTQADAPTASGGTTTRIAAAVDAAQGLVDSLPAGTEFSLVTYGTKTGNAPTMRTAGCTDVTTLIPHGPIDAQAAKAAVATITPRGFTPISASLRTAFTNLPATGPQSIVLVSDGEDTCGTPPCATAKDLHQQRPDLTISTVGFRTGGEGNDELACVANTTGGLFVTAENSAQLAARLRATQDLSRSAEALTSTGLAGIALGQSADDIRRSNPDLPAVSANGQVTVVWKDCDLTFSDGALSSIAPRDGGRTIDGVAAGSTVQSAIEFYGDPVSREERSDGTEQLVFVADEASGTAYRMTVDGAGDDAKITTIVLCKCLPKTADPTALTFGGTDKIQAGMKESELSSVGISPLPAKEHGCNTYPVPGASYLQVYATRGKVLGVRSAYDMSTRQYNPAAHTANGIHVGSTAGDARAAFAGASITESYQGMNSTSLMLIKDSSGKYLGLVFPNVGGVESSIPDSAKVQSIHAGNKDLSSGYEVCSG